MGQGEVRVGKISSGNSEVDKDDRGEEVRIFCD